MSELITLTMRVGTSHYDSYYKHQSIDVAVDQIATVSSSTTTGSASVVVLKNGHSFNCAETQESIREALRGCGFTIESKMIREIPADKSVRFG